MFNASRGSSVRSAVKVSVPSRDVSGFWATGDSRAGKAPLIPMLSKIPGALMIAKESSVAAVLKDWTDGWVVSKVRVAARWRVWV